MILLSDICLYKFWDIKLDGTVFNYLDSPKGIVASVSTLYIVTVVVIFLLVSFTLFDFLRHLFPKELPLCQPRSKQYLHTVTTLLLGGLIFLGIRGGIGKSTANVGMVYYSQNEIGRAHV